MYSVAASYFEPSEIIAIDLDTDALEIARQNIEKYELEDQVKVINTDILKLMDGQGEKEIDLVGYFDTVIMNPPFGTKNNEGIDMKLLTACV